MNAARCCYAATTVAERLETILEEDGDASVAARLPPWDALVGDEEPAPGVARAFWEQLLAGLSQPDLSAPWRDIPPPRVEWHLLFYMSTPNELERGTVADVAKLLAVRTPPGMVMTVLARTETLGSWELRCDSESRTAMRLADAVATERHETLASWITASLSRDPAERAGVFVGGHGDGWDLHLGPDWSQTMSAVELAWALVGATRATGPALGDLAFLVLDAVLDVDVGRGPRVARRRRRRAHEPGLRAMGRLRGPRPAYHCIGHAARSGRRVVYAGPPRGTGCGS
jgi:hypothetical protein